MSADLWKEFGPPDQEYLQGSRDEQPDINLQPKIPNFKVPAALLLMQVPESPEGSNTNAGSISDTYPYPKYQDQSADAAHKLQPSGLSSVCENGMTDQVSTTDKSSQTTQKEVELSGVIPMTPRYSHTSGEKATSSHSAAQKLDEDDEWGDFVEGIKPEYAELSAIQYLKPSRIEPESKVPALVGLNSTVGRPHLSEEDMIRTGTIAVTSTEKDTKQRMGTSIQGPPPSNIPPPSILLRLISSVLQSLSDIVKKYNLHAEKTQHTSRPANRTLITNFRQELAIVRASARIIAGRKLRWGRDSHLSQSMKIGPAQGGRAGGMKLTVLDKAETRREDREVEEAIRIWKEQMGILRALLSTIRTQESDDTLAIPELAEKMPIRSVKLSEGGIVASKGCFLCGLKRDERVEKVDVGVEDSFGEWWTDHWGHVDCVIFWEQQKDRLQQRS